MDRLNPTGQTAFLNRASDRISKPLDLPIEQAGSGSAASVMVSTDIIGAGTHAPVDDTRIASLKQAISSGAYELSPHRVAQAMIDAGFAHPNGGRS